MRQKNEIMHIDLDNLCVKIVELCANYALLLKKSLFLSFNMYFILIFIKTGGDQKKGSHLLKV